MDADVTPVLTAHVQLNADAEPDEGGLRSRADLIEAFVLYRPELSERVRLRLRGGAFNARRVEPMVEIDGRVGWYAGATVKRAGVFEARALRFDNRALQTVFDGKQYAWKTRFNSFGLRVELPGRVHVLGQYMDGDTHMGRTPAGQEAVVVPFYAAYGLASVPVGRHRLSLRYDWFRTEDRDVLPDLDPNGEDGSAWTACYAFEATRSLRFAAEVIRIESDRAMRPLLGGPLHAEETLVQVSWRTSF